MGVRILDAGSDAALYCSTSGWAFGPVFHSDHDHDAVERAEAFCRWLGVREPRRMTDAELEGVYSDWLAQEAAQWTAEQAAEDAQWADEDDREKGDDDGREYADPRDARDERRES